LRKIFGPPSNKTIDDFSKLSSLPMVETFQAIIIMLKSKEKQRANEGTFFSLYIWEII
jgi:hypothetical protein